MATDADKEHAKERLPDIVDSLSQSILGASAAQQSRGVLKASVAMLSNMIAPYEVTRVSLSTTLRTLKQTSGENADKFEALYESLKAEGAPGLDRFLMVLARIAQDQDAHALLCEPAGGPSTTAAAAAATHSPDMLESTTPVATQSRYAAGTGGFTPTTQERRSLANLTEQLNTPAASNTSKRTSTSSRFATRDSDAAPLEPVSATTPFRTGELHASSETPIRDAGAARPFLTGEHLWQAARPAGAARGNLSQEVSGKKLAAFEAGVQELLLLDDLLYCLQGAGGKFVQAVVPPSDGSGAPVGFELDDGVDPLVRAVAERFLPLCQHRASVLKYAESRQETSMGRVCHALSAALRLILDELDVLVAQLEHQMRCGALTLHKAWFHLAPASEVFAALHAVVMDATRRPQSAATGGGRAGLRGAALLDVLKDKEARASGNAALSGVFRRLHAACLKPYRRMLARWLEEGVVDDPFGEFFVLGDPTQKKESLASDALSAYWSGRWRLKPSAVPRFLRDVAPAVLTAGRYVDALRECGGEPWRRFCDAPSHAANAVSGGGALGLGADAGFDRRNGGSIVEARRAVGAIDMPSAGTMPSSSASDGAPADAEERRCRALVSASFSRAAEALLSAVKTGAAGGGPLLNHLRAIRSTFLLAQGDFLVHFLDQATEELSQPASKVVLSRVQSLLEMSIKSSSCASDVLLDNVSCDLERHGIVTTLLRIYDTSGDRTSDGAATASDTDEFATSTGLELFTLSYDAGWPHSVLLSRRALTKYQLLFRHLFTCKFLERRLCATWRLQQRTRSIQGGSLGVNCSLCAKMLFFIQNYIYYLTFEVFEPNWVRFEKDFAESRTLDALIEKHEAFLDTCMKECLLFKPGILRRLEAAKATCLRFCAGTLRRLAPGPDGAGEEQLDHSHIEAVAQDALFYTANEELAKTFQEQLQSLVGALKSSTLLETNLSHLVHRLAADPEVLL